MKKINNPTITSLLGLGVAAGANAAVTASPTVGSGLRPPAAVGVTNWDVDNDGTVDFLLRNSTSYFTTFSTTYTYGRIQNGAGAGFFGRAGFIDPFLKLSTGFSVGPQTGYIFGNPNSVAEVTDNGTRLGEDPVRSGWGTANNTPVTGFVGFQFTSSANIHYGFAEITFDLFAPGQGFIITSAFYESTPNTPIAVPEPETAAIGLGALALGAAGLRRWRQRKKVS
ncbi:hypothetical protein [Rubellicoccus peritrichatus]|uniref:PEP-CTERM protein-sorting domain-containing protein n=1 Tax=Rubellicoccus peritrichatus TaxID=3080537 RepID=A0AAQ3QX16_9BACT|nr:hypothetical protein [Puniceicoccus sp. CR14]WOO43218.1 hypothetical protein RZN69_08965 [Puniceicoccus sp. CR14]